MNTQECFVAPPDPKLIKILIVDDEPMLRSVIQDFLLMLGFEDQFVAGNGVEALEVIRSEQIDCMLSDIRMPKMELEELLGVIQIEYPNLIVIATSGYSDLESARNIFSKGAHDFIGKPLNLDALEMALQWIQQRREVLQIAKRLFGRETQPLEPGEGERRLTELAEALRSRLHHFKSRTAHAIRLSELVKNLELDLDPVARLDLRTASLLHELGNGYQVQSLCRQPRQLEENELRLIQENAPISGRLVSRMLNRQEFEIIIGLHLNWLVAVPQPMKLQPAEEYLSVWLGILNSMDGFLHDRPDRPALSLASMKERMIRHIKRQSLLPLTMLLDQWDRVGDFYSSGV